MWARRPCPHSFLSICPLTFFCTPITSTVVLLLEEGLVSVYVRCFVEVTIGFENFSILQILIPYQMRFKDFILQFILYIYTHTNILEVGYCIIEIGFED
jgi:hypothetical protein